MVGGTIPPQSDSGEISRVLVLNLLWQSKRCSRTAQDISVLTTPSLLSRDVRIEESWSMCWTESMVGGNDLPPTIDSVQHIDHDSSMRTSLDKSEGVVKTEISWAVREHRLLCQRRLRTKTLEISPESLCGGVVPPTIDST